MKAMRIDAEPVWLARCVEFVKQEGSIFFINDVVCYVCVCVCVCST